ncbi:MAG: hypothetical protein R3B90_13310 [Planctomycetaceae bacterium]
MSTQLAAKRLDDLLDQSLWVMIGLVVAVLLLAWVIHQLRSWYGEDEDRTAAHQELLTSLRELHREGDVSEAEYRSIKGHLTGKMERKVEAESDSDATSAG